MRRRSIAIVIIGVLVSVLSGVGGSLAAAAERQDITINGNNKSRSVFCHGQRVLVNGNANHVQLSGHCRRVDINGNDNAVVLYAVVPVVSVNGNHNQVSVSIAHNPSPPRIHDNGNDNLIRGIP